MLYLYQVIECMNSKDFLSSLFFKCKTSLSIMSLDEQGQEANRKGVLGWMNLNVNARRAAFSWSV